METRSILSLNWAAESKVDKFQVEVVINKNVFWFEVSMGETFGMKVVQSLKQLLEIVSANWLAQRSRVSYVVEQLTTKNWFLSNIGNW